MKKWLKNLSPVALAGFGRRRRSLYKADAAGFGHGNRPGADMKIIASLGLGSDEQTALTTALYNFNISSHINIPDRIRWDICFA